MIKSFLRQAGFTMIELLVVIAVLGVLATAVLSAINPIEQINKGRDTGHRSDAEQLINAVDRYFALHELYPWNDPGYNENITADGLIGDEFPGANDGGGTNCTATTHDAGSFCAIPTTDGATSAVAGCTLGTTSTWMCALTDTAEVKAGFTSRLANAKAGNELLLYKAAGDTSVLYVCFKPQSKGFKKEAEDTCERDLCSGGTPVLPTGVCPGTCAGAVYSSSAVVGEEDLICLP